MSSLRGNIEKFSFTPYLPQEGKKKPIIFRALIDSISDSYNPQWGEYMDMGRADPKFMYSQYSRTINLEFKIASLYKDEHFKHMAAMNSLAALTFPIYKQGKGFNGIYVKFELAEFITEMGLISSLTFNVDNNSPWIDGLPLYIQCSLTFRVIGEYKPDYRKPLNKGPYYKGEYKEGFQS